MKVKRSETLALIEAHIREHGVTRCPTTALESRYGTILPEDSAAIREHDALRYEVEHSLDEGARRNARSLLKTNRAAFARKREGRR